MAQPRTSSPGPILPMPPGAETRTRRACAMPGMRTRSSIPGRLHVEQLGVQATAAHELFMRALDRKSTRLNSSHVSISYAVFCLKKKKLKLPIAAITNEEHVVKHLFVASTHAYILAFPWRRRMHRIKVSEVP